MLEPCESLTTPNVTAQEALGRPIVRLRVGGSPLTSLHLSITGSVLKWKVKLLKLKKGPSTVGSKAYSDRSQYRGGIEKFVSIYQCPRAKKPKVARYRESTRTAQCQCRYSADPL